MNDPLHTMLSYHQALDPLPLVRSFRDRCEAYRRQRRKIVLGFALIALTVTVVLGGWLGWSWDMLQPLFLGFDALEQLPTYGWMGMAALGLALAWLLEPEAGWYRV